MHKQVVGSCSQCGGVVSVATVYMSVNPPVPHCEKCGACAAPPRGPVIEMTPRRAASPEDLFRNAAIRAEANRQ